MCLLVLKKRTIKCVSLDKRATSTITTNNNLYIIIKATTTTIKIKKTIRMATKLKRKQQQI